MRYYEVGGLRMEDFGFEIELESYALRMIGNQDLRISSYHTNI